MCMCRSLSPLLNFHLRSLLPRLHWKEPSPSPPPSAGSSRLKTLAKKSSLRLSLPPKSTTHTQTQLKRSPIQKHPHSASEDKVTGTYFLSADSQNGAQPRRHSFGTVREHAKEKSLTAILQQQPTVLKTPAGFVS